MTAGTIPEAGRRGRGRPVGSTKPEKKRGHEVTLSEEAWAYAVAQGNASRFIERLIQGHMAGGKP